MENQLKDQRKEDRGEDPDTMKKMEAEGPNWRPVKLRMKDGEKFIILGDYEMSREEFLTMAKHSMKKEEIEKVEKGLFAPESDELPQKILES